MSVDPVPRSAPLPAGHEHTGLARWAVGIATATATVVAVSYTIFAVAYAVGGDDAVSDTWVGYVAGFALLGGLGAALFAFLLAAAAKLRHEQWRWLRLPLALFPVLAGATLLAEVFWME